ncbi:MULTISPECIES: tetratricopeptide repeat protein [Burkholderia]|uniref:Tetratricopeptide repeat protein n=1 Tax=Burkholderia pyrrocinia TaxID=60550 RepID=A0A318IN51_BURPY|nr:MULTISPECIES: tetratricopeptide repeat protein [Burkholderia]PXX35431.1 tetratricopeptide repeat protein [Burkholderia pyrrocinia]SFW41946.1 Tetratricopeptide repeat-containing protein [Burkholderia sp. NFACC33-1]SFX71590.1 Tetratricopeptide repeat-containing protein [Burkholderia sp. NFPP32]
MPTRPPTSTVPPAPDARRVERLLSFLETDPDNLNLLADAATAAFDAHRFTLCDELLDRHAARAPLPAALANLRGLAALSQHRFDAALHALEPLLTTHDDASIRYNAAYANAMLGRFGKAVELLDDATLSGESRAIPLKLRVLHHLGQLDDAIALGRRHADSHAASPELYGALATALFDTADLDGARRYAEQSVDTVDGLTVRGLLALDAGSIDNARALFRRAHAINPDGARATLGIGLVDLAEQRFTDATGTLDRAANLLKIHAGAWAAAAWAYLFDGNPDAARIRFERAAELDRGFADAHGGLAVLCVHEGRFDEARRNMAIARRLDASCLSAALTESLLATHAGDTRTADEIRCAALDRPLGPDGRTLAQALARYSVRDK